MENEWKSFINPVVGNKVMKRRAMSSLPAKAYVARAMVVSLPLVACLADPSTGVTAERAAAIHRGEQLVTRNCSRCHAVGRAGPSRHPEAPPFRNLAAKYPIEALEEALAEGIVSGHPDMPEFRFSADDVAAIIIYLKSIQD